MDTIFQLILNGIAIGSIYALVAIGLTLIFGIIEVVNFAHGAFVMLSMYASYWLFTLFGIDPYLGLAITVPAFFLLGVVVERLIIHKVTDASPYVQIFATNGLALVIVSLATIFWGPNYRDVPVPYGFADVDIFGARIGLTSLIGIGVNVTAIVCLLLFLKSTFLGKAISAVSQQKTGAKIVGINVPFLYTLSFGIGIAYAAIAGTTMSTLYSVYPTAGNGIILIAFVTVILGGYNSILGSFVGGMIIGLVEVFTAYFLSSQVKEIMYFAIFIAILLLRPNGLLGRPAT